MTILKNQNGEDLYVLTISSNDCSFPEVHICTHEKCRNIIDKIRKPIDGREVRLMRTIVCGDTFSIVLKWKFERNKEWCYQYIMLKPAKAE